MSDIEPPAVARLRVRLELRSAREAKQLTQGQVAQAMEWSLSKVMRIEKGEVNVSPSDLKLLLDFLEIRDPVRVQRLTDAARASRQERWTTDPADREHFTPAMNELQQFEAAATTIRVYQNLIVPGILQTRAYAEALFGTTGGVSGLERIAARVDSRQRRRRELLYRPSPPTCLVVLEESVLMRPIGGPAVMADQLEDLMRTVAETPLQVRILTFLASARLQISYGAFLLSDLDERSVLVYRETGTSDEVIYVQEDVDRHRRVFEELWANALDEEATADRITAAIAAYARMGPNA
jgi:transcriptional regulator with XRE-family HTH domain